MLGDQPYNSFKIYFWIGAKSVDADGAFEMCMRELQDLMEEHKGGAKMRIHVEYQYAESFNFFTLFRMFEREQDATASKLNSMYYGIQYQDYLINKVERS